MKHKTASALLGALIITGTMFAQKKNISVKKTQEYYSESGQPLILKEKKDSKGQVIEKDFCYKSDTSKIEHKDFFTNGKITLAAYYADNRISFKVLYDEKGSESETDFIDAEGNIKEKNVYTRQPNGTTKTITLDKDGNKKSEETVDGDNRSLERIDYKTDGSVSYRETTKYDGKLGQTHKTETTGYDGAGNVILKSVHNRDTKQKATTEYYANGKMKSYEVQEDAYSINMHYSEMDTYEEDGSYRTQKMKGFKNGGSLPIDIHWYDKDGKLSLRSVSTYSPEGYKLEEDWYNGSEKLMYKDTYTNDAKGNATDILRTLPDGTTRHVDAMGQEVK